MCCAQQAVRHCIASPPNCAHTRGTHISASPTHRLETNKLRNVARLFGHLLATDAIPWSVLGVIRLTEEDTTSSSRIFIKILFQVGIGCCGCCRIWFWQGEG